MTPLLEVQHLEKKFSLRRGWRSTRREIRAVDDVSITIHEKETLGLVGESGCGKSTLGMAILRLVEPTAGKVIFDGRDVTAMTKTELREFRRDSQIVFQDPYGSLNPRMRVKQIVGEAFLIHKLVPRKMLKENVVSVLETVGLGSEVLDRFPHEFSGGQRQRIGIARALAVSPRFLVADEPVSALDVSIQAQIVNLLLELQEKRNLTYLFISHDLRIVQFISHRIAVMYFGRIVELLPAEHFASSARHPYTRALLEAVPVADPKTKRERIVLGGEVPSPFAPPAGCVFHTRCPLVEDRCRREEPLIRELSPGHKVACHVV